MKKLKRIESVLNQTSGRSPAGVASSRPAIDPPDVRPISFDLLPKSDGVPQPELSQPNLPAGSITPPSAPDLKQPATDANLSALSWQLAPVRNAEEISLSLPRVDTGFTTHRNAANPALATNLLKEIETLVMGWQVELQQILRQIQDIYLDGPIVDGWLESYAQEELDSPMLRHAEVGCLIDYVEKTWGSAGAESGSESASQNPPPEANPTGYRLCGLNEEGQLWFRHCPPEQIAVVSLAIARYQKLKLLLTRKQSLETRLSQLAETLIAMHADLKQD